MAFANSGKQRRLARLFRHSDGRAVILPIDDGLISGPCARLSDLSTLFSTIGSSPPDGILLFAGVLTPALGCAWRGGSDRERNRKH